MINLEAKLGFLLIEHEERTQKIHKQKDLLLQPRSHLRNFASTCSSEEGPAASIIERTFSRAIIAER